ncbi:MULTISPECIES: hypothetical protein [Bacillus]|uniref:hypothetical protein n=1 Tax=Bacillus TaxID=1386 RepID=UPI000BB8249B|nr:MULTISPECIES: hypothetical protein [Bacillus]
MIKHQVNKIIPFVTVILVLSVVIYYVYSNIAPAKSFFEGQELTVQLNKISTERSVKEILEVIYLDDIRVYIPFVTNKDEYGASLWEWKKNKWNAIGHYNHSTPFVWSNENGEETYFVWNIDPKDEIQSMNFFLIRDRGYYITDNGKEKIERYDPKIQLSYEVSDMKHTYGVVPVPKEWETISEYYRNTADGEGSLFSYPTSKYLKFGWIPYDESGEEAYAFHSSHGGGFRYDSYYLHFMEYVSEYDIE